MRDLIRFSKVKHLSKIEKIHAREVLDSRGNPTVEVDLYTRDGRFRAMVPSGASTGSYEAVELRDNDLARYKGKGVLEAVENINTALSNAVIGMECIEQDKIDKVMIDLDGTENKRRLGANSIVGVSMAVCKAGAASVGIPLYQYIANSAEVKDFVLPTPCFNVINGGVHAGNLLAMQEFMIAPTGADNFRDALRMGSEVYHTLKAQINEVYGKEATNVGDEGGFAPNLKDGNSCLELLSKAISKAGYENEVKMAIDPAASEFLVDGSYDLNFKIPNLKGKDVKSGGEMIGLYKSYVENYDIAFLEDPFAEDDWKNFSDLTADIGKEIEIIGDDLLVTNPNRIREGMSRRAVNGLLLKINQIGTVTECIASCKMAQNNEWGVLVSHRSGETDDSFIADLSVGLRTGHIKSGAPCRSERLAKYNQLARIEEELNGNCKYAGNNFRNP